MEKNSSRSGRLSGPLFESVAAGSGDAIKVKRKMWIEPGTSASALSGSGEKALARCSAHFPSKSINETNFGKILRYALSFFSRILASNPVFERL